MNYEKNYYDYCAYVKTLNRKKEKRLLKDGSINPNYIYYERHHIIPKCCNGEDNENNLVLFTAREHFLAHYLLCKIYKNNFIIYKKLSKAFFMMTVFKSSSQLRFYNSRLYELCRNNLDLSPSPEAREKISKAAKLKVGNKNSFYGKKHSISSINQMKESHKRYFENGGKVPFKGSHHTEESKRKLSEAKINIKLTEDHKKRISEGCLLVKEKLSANKGRVWCNNGETQIFLKANEQIPEGFIRGQLPASEEFKQACRKSYVKHKTLGSSGMHWWNNGTINKMSKDCPLGFSKGKLPI